MNLNESGPESTMTMMTVWTAYGRRTRLETGWKTKRMPKPIVATAACVSEPLLCCKK
jgi:hypothetical protein